MAEGGRDGWRTVDEPSGVVILVYLEANKQTGSVGTRGKLAGRVYIMDPNVPI